MLDFIGTAPLSFVLDAFSTAQIVVETATKEVRTFVECALVTV